MAKLTNQEILTEVSNMSKADSANLGVTPELKEMAGELVRGNLGVKSAFYGTYTPLYNAFCGFVVKFTLADLSKATYSDLYRRHHRNMTQGRPQLGFVKLASAGTGNSSAQMANSPAIGSLTTVTTADHPDVVALYDIAHKAYVARVPISFEDVKTALNDEYGINDLMVKVRESLEDYITYQRNADYDTAFSTAASNAIAEGSGSEISANAAKATYGLVNVGDVSGITTGDYSSWTDDELISVYTALKTRFYAMTGRPSDVYNALGELNNVNKRDMIVYIDGALWAAMTSRIAAFAYDAEQLRGEGLEIVAFNAPWLRTSTSTGYTIAAIGSVNFIRDYPTSDFAKVLEADRGSIINRFVDVSIAAAGYECFTFIKAVPAASTAYAAHKITIKTSLSSHPSNMYLNEYKSADAYTEETAEISHYNDVVIFASVTTKAYLGGVSTGYNTTFKLTYADGSIEEKTVAYAAASTPFNLYKTVGSGVIPVDIIELTGYSS